MDKDLLWLKWSLRAGSIYFLLVSAVHSLEFKVPGLFIYFDVPSFAYQDHIISFLSLGWSVLFWVAALDPIRDTRLLNSVLIMGVIGLIGLGRINLTTDFESLKAGLQPGLYWIETAILAGYLLLLVILTLRLRREG